MILWSMHSHASIKPSFTLLLYWIAVFYSLPKCFLLILHGGNRKKKRQAKLCYCGKSDSSPQEEMQTLPLQILLLLFFYLNTGVMFIHDIFPAACS